ncbi:MAG TPA: transporter substrate-binding domain-containing protein [Fibrobacteria bacterium]|nr:transporter substrate-binding domain-containing protein [Fibrobacteria bacterium]
MPGDGGVSSRTADAKMTGFRRVWGIPPRRMAATAKAFLLGFLVAVPVCGDTKEPRDAILRITNGEWPPFTSRAFVHGGVLSRIVADAFAQEGIEVRYGYFPWKRAYAYARDGIWDGSVGWAPTPAHLRDLRMSDPVIHVDKALYHLKGVSFDWKTIDDLRRWRIGGTAGYSYGPEWDKAVLEGRLKVEEVALDEQNIDKLVTGRVDAVAMEVDVAEYLIRTRLSKADADRIVRHPSLLVSTPVCLSLSRKLRDAPALIERFNRGLAKLKASGRYSGYLAESRKGGYLPVEPGGD